jgi:hypothetical protein
MIIFSDDLMKARERCIRAESESELATDLEDQPMKRRSRNKTIQSESGNDDDDDDDILNIKYPNPPKL